MFISINGLHFPTNCFRALSCNATQDTLQIKQQYFNSAISKSWLAMVLCFEAQKEIHFFGLYSQGAEDFPSRARFGKRTEKPESSKSVKFNFLSTLTKRFAAEFEAIKYLQHISTCLWSALYLPFGGCTAHCMIVLHLSGLRQTWNWWSEVKGRIGARSDDSFYN